ncbi:MAG: hypothetical protein J2P50_15615, partial [Hyphomicrobiaceae bacterium]|nr:hypothetical protein [Hyphomicrobiaceae bacterium]
MRATRPEFEVAPSFGSRITWFSLLIGLARSYRIMIAYGPVPVAADAPLLDRIPLVRILNPRLQPRWDAEDEAPLPHVFFDRHDSSLSPLCACGSCRPGTG